MAAYPISVLGFGDNVVDKYEHIKTMYPGGNAVNFAVFAKKLGVDRSAYMGIFGSDEEAERLRTRASSFFAASRSWASTAPLA